MCWRRCGEAGGSAVAVVVGPDAGAVSAEATRNAPGADIFVQKERRGTAHAVLAAGDALARGADDVLVIFGDTPLIRPQTLRRMREALAKGAAIAVLGFRPKDPTGYGRLVMEGSELVAIREELDATPAERAIDLCNGGLMAFAGKTAMTILKRIGNDNRKGEFYLTDAIAIARAMKLKAVVIETEEDDVRGINTKAQLAETEAALQQRLRKAAMDAGVTLVAPETVFLAADTKFGRDVTVEPYVVFGPGVTVEDNAVIRSFSHLDHAHVGKGALVGPYARLRPGAKLGADVHIGNFVEVKEVGDRGRRQGQSSRLYRRRPSRRRLELRRRRDRLQLRRRHQAPHRHRQGRVHRVECGAGRAGLDRRRRLCRDRIGDHPQRASGRAWRSRASGRWLRKVAHPGSARSRRRPSRSGARPSRRAAGR